jgi:ribosomal protein S21
MSEREYWEEYDAIKVRKESSAPKKIRRSVKW